MNWTHWWYCLFAHAVCVFSALNTLTEKCKSSNAWKLFQKIAFHLAGQFAADYWFLAYFIGTIQSHSVEFALGSLMCPDEFKLVCFPWKFPLWLFDSLTDYFCTIKTRIKITNNVIHGLFASGFLQCIMSVYSMGIQ